MLMPAGWTANIWRCSPACSRHRNRRIRTTAIGLLLTLQQPVDVDEPALSLH